MFKWIWTIFSLGAPELGESESWIKLVTSNYCTCDLWTTLLLGGKTFTIIEAFFCFFGFEFRPHSIIPVTWNQYNIYSHTSSTYHSLEGHHWLINWVTKTHPPSTPVENCNPICRPDSYLTSMIAKRISYALSRKRLFLNIVLLVFLVSFFSPSWTLPLATLMWTHV